MMLAGLLVFVAALSLVTHGYPFSSGVLFALAAVLLILGRPTPSVEEMIRKGRK